MAAPYTATTVLPGYSSTDYGGSYEEWFERTVTGMIDNYLDGIGQTSGFINPTLGAPNEADFGSRKDGRGTNGSGVVSVATEMFFENYVRSFGDSDPWITQHFGHAPGRKATFGVDPNSPSALQGTYSERSAFDREQAGLDREADQRIADTYAGATKYSADQSLLATRERIEADWKTAIMEDATRRYIAEGDWGTQRFIADLQETGMMDRLQLELGFRREELAQRAVEARNQHHEAMVGLVLEVAKYDAELAAQPRNWLKYASWLQNRGEVVNGLNLAMAADVVPDEQISGAEALQAGAPGAEIAGAQAIAEESAYQVGGIDLTNTDYAGMTNQLLGVNSQQQWQPPTTDELNAVSATLQTGQPAAPSPTPQPAAPMTAESAATAPPTGQGQPGFGAYSGPTLNNLGMEIQPSGHKEDYRKFRKLLPSQQQMRMGEVESIGRYSPDFLEEMERSRPKGRTTGAAAYG